MKRAAITGITGQDGTYLARWLLRQGYEIHGLLRFPFEMEVPRLRGRFSPQDLAAVRWHQGSLEDSFSLVRFFKAAQPDEVYHLAGLTDSRHSFLVPEEAMGSIALGTLRLLEATREICSGARVFIASSCEVFGVPACSPQDENTRLQPFTPYGIAKMAAQQFARLHRENYGQFVAVGILYNHESPLRSPNYLSNRVAQVVAAIQEGQAKELQIGGLNAERDWSDARDFVRGFWLALQAQAADDYVFASGVSRRVADFVDCAFRAAGLQSSEFVNVTELNSASQQAAIGLCGDPRRAEATLGWKREWSFEATIQDLVYAELERRPEMERADPLPQRPGMGAPAVIPRSFAPE